MIKLAASLILVDDSKVMAFAGNSDAQSTPGAVTYISNATNETLADNQLETTSLSYVLYGNTSADEILMLKASYNEKLYVPVLGQLEEIRAGEYGICSTKPDSALCIYLHMSDSRRNPAVLDKKSKSS